ncbi:MAG: hypothetical protein J0H68_01590 [Sphingobacteriia bacterium]|nr:hypothetical protein [Sphingobacteriia bacterium]
MKKNKIEFEESYSLDHDSPLFPLKLKDVTIDSHEMLEKFIAFYSKPNPPLALPKHLKIEGLEFEFEVLSNLTNLKSLSLESCTITDNWQGLTKLVNLRSLNLSNLEADFDLINIANLKSLIDLEIDSVELENPEILNTLTTLKHLKLSDSNIANFKYIRKLTQLESLHINREFGFKHLNLLNSFTELKKLIISVNEIDFAQTISDLHNLEYLDISACEKLIHSSTLTNLGNLKELRLSPNLLCKLSEVSALSNIKTLRIDNFLILEEEDLKYIQNLPNLKNIVLITDNIDISSIKTLPAFNKIYENFLIFAGRLMNELTIKIFCSNDLQELMNDIRRKAIAELEKEKLQREQNNLNEGPDPASKRKREEDKDPEYKESKRAKIGF